MKAATADPDALMRMLTRLKLTAIRDQLDSLLDTATRRKLTLLDTVKLLCEAEVARKDERRIQMASSIAKFPFVRTLEGGELEELSELRLILECHATRSATAKITDSELAALRAEFEALKAKRIEDHITEFTALDTRFHSTIYRVAGNRRIEEILLNLKDQIVWVRAVTATLRDPGSDLGRQAPDSWSGREDSNLRLQRPERCARPS